jgi:phosphoribosylaminoimidazole-succinocarboxamide synthase
MRALESTSLFRVPFLRRGKVRDLYDLGDALLIVSTDRVSAFDAVLTPGIPDKGKILNQLSNFWFRQFPEIENHVLETRFENFPKALELDREELVGRSVIVKKCRVIPFECVARGYLAGSGLKDYRKSGHICEIALPPGLQEAAKLPEPIFTPATKSESGHDENVPFRVLENALGRKRAEELRDLTLSIFGRVSAMAAAKGILLADSKIEFGEIDGRLVWIDEAFTPDSSRFWPAGEYRHGSSPPSLDKQFIRDWLEKVGWNKTPPAPPLPPDVVEGTRRRYLDAFRRLTGGEPEYL